MTIQTGWTPNPLKYCVRCGGVHEDQLYELCQVCRDGDKLAEELSPEEKMTPDLLQLMRDHEWEMLQDVQNELASDDADFTDLQDDRRAEMDRLDTINYCRMGY
jgi:hypothetical protein